MARARIQLEHQRDFTGGLNINADPYNLAPNESFDLQNVDIDRRGGFAIRRGSRRFINTSTSPMSTPDTLYTYIDPTGVRHLLAARGGEIRRWDGAAWVQIQAAVASGTVRFAEMNGALYIFHNSNGVWKWSGVGLTALVPQPVYNDNLAAPVGGRFVRGRVGCVHNGVMFSANIIDTLDGLGHPSRIRWSHPGKPEDWRTNDWIDIDPEDGAGQINALVPMGDRLIVFKDRAIYAVHGFPPEGFSVTNITRDVGTPTPYSVTVDRETIYFWDTVKGAHRLTEKSLDWIFEPLWPFIDDNKINMPFSFQVLAQFHNERVWFSIPWLAAPYAGRFIGLVYAPAVGKNGAWTLHDKTLFSFHVHRASTGGDAHLLGGATNAPVGQGYVMEMDVENYYLDETPNTGATSRVNAWYTTRWFDGGNPALRKRFKRSIIVVGRNANQEFHVDVFDDYDPTHVKRSFSMFTDVNGVEGVWDISDWDEVVWANEIGEASMILKGSPLGTGTAKALRFSNVTSGVDWRIHGVTMKWIPKIIRN